MPPFGSCCALTFIIVTLFASVSARYEYTKYVSDPMKMMMEKPSPYGYGGQYFRSYKDQMGLLKRRWSGQNGYYASRSPYEMFGSSLGDTAYQRRMASMSVPYHSFFAGY